MTTLTGLLIGAFVGWLAASFARVGGREWRQLSSIGGGSSGALTAWLSADAPPGTLVDVQALGSAVIAAVAVVTMMRVIRVRKSDRTDQRAVLAARLLAFSDAQWRTSRLIPALTRTVFAPAACLARRGRPGPEPQNP